jgi:hypothetical protein
VDNYHGTGRVQGALMTDRTEQQTGEAAVPTRSDDQEIRVAGFLDEHLGGLPQPERPSDMNALRPVSEGTQGVIQFCSRALLEHGRVDMRTVSADPDVGPCLQAPGHHHQKIGSPQPGLVEREVQRFLRAFRAIKSNYDLSHFTSPQIYLFGFRAQLVRFT